MKVTNRKSPRSQIKYYGYKVIMTKNTVVVIKLRNMLLGKKTKKFCSIFF